jgi:hypothetical protein
VINLAYYLAVGVFALPDNYGYATSLPLWRDQPLLPIVAVAMTTCALGVAGRLFVAARQKMPERLRQALWFAAWWSLIALYPVILTATGRTAFMSSIGIAWMLAIGWAAIWQVADRRRTWCAVALILLVGTHAGVASYRACWWQQAGNEMERAIARIDASLADIPPGAAVCVVGLPDHLHHAYVFRNAFPALNQERFPDHVVHAFLDSESDAALQDERCRDLINLRGSGQAGRGTVRPVPADALIAASTPTSLSIVAGHVLRAKPLLTQMVIHPGDVVGGQRDFRIEAIVDQVAVGAVLVAALQHRLQV